jgi:hypothetical protein
MLFPTKDSVEALNGPKQHKRSKTSSSRKYVTIADRINALRFEQERVYQGMCIDFAGFPMFNQMWIFFIGALLGFAAIEGFRLFTFMRGMRAGEADWETASKWTTFAEFEKGTGACGLEGQLDTHQELARMRSLPDFFR